MKPNPKAPYQMHFKTFKQYCLATEEQQAKVNIVYYFHDLVFIRVILFD
jgi:hypothetical protein